jgi:hypothetical protein
MFSLTIAKVADALVLYAVIHLLTWAGAKAFVRTERTIAIRTHYRDKAKGLGHAAKSVIDCVEGDCKLFVKEP